MTALPVLFISHLEESTAFKKWKKWKSLSCVWLCNPMSCSQPGSIVHGILQVRILEWVAISFRGSLQPRDWTWISCVGGRFFTIWTTREALQSMLLNSISLSPIYLMFSCVMGFSYLMGNFDRVTVSLKHLQRLPQVCMTKSNHFILTVTITHKLDPISFCKWSSITFLQTSYISNLNSPLHVLSTLLELSSLHSLVYATSAVFSAPQFCLSFKTYLIVTGMTHPHLTYPLSLPLKFLIERHFVAF